jgi:hypothetical protein
VPKLVKDRSDERKASEVRKSNVKNKYKLIQDDLGRLELMDSSQLREPLFKRNETLSAWCISEDTVRNSDDTKYGTYSEYWIGVYDERGNGKERVQVLCSTSGGLETYSFNRFFDEKTIANEMDLDIQERLLRRLNSLLDKGILRVKRP